MLSVCKFNLPQVPIKIYLIKWKDRSDVLGQIIVAVRCNVAAIAGVLSAHPRKLPIASPAYY